VGHAVFGMSLALWYGVLRGLSRGGIVPNDGNGCGIIVIGGSSRVVLLCGELLG
jgi:hypothetical protein